MHGLVMLFGNNTTHTGVLVWDLDFHLGGCNSELSVCRECLVCTCLVLIDDTHDC